MNTFQAPLTEAQLRETVAAIETATAAGALWPAPRGAINAYGGTSAVHVAAAALKVTPSTVLHRLRAAHGRHGLAPNGIAPPVRGAARAAAQPPQPTPSPEQSRSERLNAEFWRRKAVKAEAALAESEHLARELAGVRRLPMSPPDWGPPVDGGARGRSVIGCLISDVHMGEVINETEILGVNRFDPDICRARLQRYFEAACTVGARWAADTDCQGALLVLGGDLVSGAIHEEHAATNALTSPEQVIAVAEALAAGIRQLAAHYGRVHVVSVPGNHGRTTHKPTAKLYARLSYDIMVAAMLEQRFRHDERLSFQHGESKDQLVPVFGRSIFVTHGDKIGTKGGMGFAGPMLPIVRGTKKVQAQQALLGRRPDLILHGHYHTTGNAGAVLSNGAVPGYGEYADDLRAEPEPPQQWLFLLHDKWWLRERAAIQLEAPGIPPKPRVRVPMGWEQAHD